jgi:hypothetical protein
MCRSMCKTDPTIVFSYTFTYALASTFTNTPSTHSSFQGIEVTATAPEIPSIRADLDPANIVEGSHTRKPSSRAQGFAVHFEPRVCFEPGVNMAFIILQTTKNQRYHHNDLPLEPENWQE